MDCCETNSNKKEMKGGSFKMDRKLIMWIVIGVLVLAVVYLTFKAGSSSGNAVVETAGAVKSAAQSAASGGMVGGC